MSNPSSSAPYPVLPGQTPQQPGSKPATPKAPQKEKRAVTAADRILLAFALLLGVLFDRLFLYYNLYYDPWMIRPARAVFWLAFLAVFYALNWKKLKSDLLLWTVAGFTAALCVWNLLFDTRTPYGEITGLVVPAVLMAHAAVTHSGYKLTQVASIVQAWFLGWLVMPFSAIHTWFGALSSLVTGDGKKTNLLKVLCAIGISIPLLLVIVPLLGSADPVFGHYIRALLRNFNLAEITFHLGLILLSSIFLYSFLWNVRFRPVPQAVPEATLRLDTLVCSVVLGILLSVYLLFCAVQFTYLFARAGLPMDMTYSEYAREGFWQLILVSGINLLLFGVLLQFGKAHRSLTIMLAGLLAVTFVMLLSGIMRLGLYISTYGMTWLRLLSAWFILYLGAVLVLCGVRIVHVKLPLIGVCAVLLLGWYTALGYLNPEGFIQNYNLKAADIHMNVREATANPQLLTEGAANCEIVA